MVDYTAIFNKFNEQPRNLLEAVEANRLKNQQNQQNEMALRKQKQSVDFDEQNNPLKLAKAQFDNMSEQDKFVEQELLQGSIELQPFLDAKDSQSVMQSLQMRRNKLAQNGLRTDEIDNAIQLAQQGDFDTLKQLTGSQIQGAKALGLFQDNSQNLPAVLQVTDRLAQARQDLKSSDSQVVSNAKNTINDIIRIAKVEKLPVGVTQNPDGSVENIGGLTDTITEQEDAKQKAKIPTARAIANIDVDKANQINRNTNTAELNQKDALKIQELKQSLPIAENVTVNAIMGIDDTIGKLEKAKSMVGANTAGWEGLLSIMPVSDYNDLKVQLQTIKSRFGLDSLLKLKNSGGTLGQIAVKEFEALQDSISNITQAQRPEQLKQNMDDAIQQMKRTQDSIERAYVAEYGRVLGQPQETQTQTTQQPQQSNQNDDPLGLFQ
jgi:hypothetical protein